MSTFILQSLFLIAVAYFLGAIVGCWMRKIFKNSASMLHRSRDEIEAAPAIATATAGAAATVGATRYAGEDGEASIEIKRSEPRQEGTVEESVYVAPVEVPAERETISYVDPEPVSPVVQETVIPVVQETVVAPVREPVVEDLTKIKGIGLPVALELKKIGITRFEQVASWNDQDIGEISQKLGFSGRIERENWMAQAQILAKGDELEFTTHQLAQAEQNTSSQDIGKLISDANSAHGRGASQKGDDLKRISGIGASVEASLNQIGVTRFSHIANWNADEVDAISRRLGIDQRIKEENWVQQARNLDTTNA